MLFHFRAEYDPEKNETKYDKFLQAVTRMSYYTMENLYNSTIDLLDDEEVKKANLRYLAFEAAVSCNDTISHCRYKDEPIDCCEIFFPALTENGFCYIFNGKYKDGLDKEELVAEQHSLFETDKKWGLKFVPTRIADIYLHSYLETTTFDFKPPVTWAANFAIDLLISMKQTYTTDQATQLTIAQRKCIFEHERKMIYRKENYTFTGCMRECRIANSMKYCGCVAPFYISDTRTLKYCKIVSS